MIVSECRLSQGKKSIADIWRFAWYGCRTFQSHISVLRHADLIYVNGNRLLPVAMLAQLILGRKAAYHIHLNHGGLERKLFLLALRLKSTRALVLPSEFIRRELLAADARFADPRVQVVPNGLDARFSNIYGQAFAAYRHRGARFAGKRAGCAHPAGEELSSAAFSCAGGRGFFIRRLL